VAQEASAEVMVARVGYERKKKKLQMREKGWKEKREKVAVAAWWPFSGCDGSCGGAGVRERNGGRNGGSVGCLWWRKKEKDAEEENLQRGEGRPRGGCAYQW